MAQTVEETRDRFVRRQLRRAQRAIREGNGIGAIALIEDAVRRLDPLAVEMVVELASPRQMRAQGIRPFIIEGGDDGGSGAEAVPVGDGRGGGVGGGGGRGGGRSSPGGGSGSGPEAVDG